MEIVFIQGVSEKVVNMVWYCFKNKLEFDNEFGLEFYFCYLFLEQGIFGYFCLNDCIMCILIVSDIFKDVLFVEVVCQVIEKGLKIVND